MWRLRVKRKDARRAGSETLQEPVACSMCHTRRVPVLVECWSNWCLYDAARRMATVGGSPPCKPHDCTSIGKYRQRMTSASPSRSTCTQIWNGMRIFSFVSKWAALSRLELAENPGNRDRQRMGCCCHIPGILRSGRYIVNCPSKTVNRSARRRLFDAAGSKCCTRLKCTLLTYRTIEPSARPRSMHASTARQSCSGANQHLRPIPCWDLTLRCLLRAVP